MEPQGGGFAGLDDDVPFSIGLHVKFPGCKVRLGLGSFDHASLIPKMG